MLNNSITTVDIYRAIISNYNERVMCVHSDDNDESIIFRIKIYPETSADIITDMKALEQELMQLVIKGISGIKNVSTQPDSEVMHINMDTLKLEPLTSKL